MGEDHFTKKVYVLDKYDERDTGRSRWLGMVKKTYNAKPMELRR